MHTETEYLIWDKIVNNAKSRFDIELYSNKFKDMNPHIIDTMILHIIAAFASGENHCSIATNLHNELQNVGVDVREEIIDTIVSDKHIVFSTEIYAAYLAFTMMERGDDEKLILEYVSELLECPRVQ